MPTSDVTIGKFSTRACGDFLKVTTLVGTVDGREEGEMPSLPRDSNASAAFRPSMSDPAVLDGLARHYFCVDYSRNILLPFEGIATLGNVGATSRTPETA